MGKEKKGWLSYVSEALTSYGSSRWIFSRWFEGHYAAFLHVDRVVIDPQFRGSRAGRRLYGDIFEHAEHHQAGIVICEVNIQPPNPVSMRFHLQQGFQPVGQQR